MTRTPIRSPEEAAARVGPNAATRVAEALAELGEGARLGEIFAEAGAREWLDCPPAQMIDERRVARLHRAVRDAFSAPRATQVLARAGFLTANYLIEHRIPRPMRAILPWLPRTWAERLFLSAISRHAWTFVGSGRFSYRVGPTTVLRIRANPLCAGERRPRDACAWHRMVFQQLFERLLRRPLDVEETSCEARGDDACGFRLVWAPPERFAATPAKRRSLGRRGMDPA